MLLALLRRIVPPLTLVLLGSLAHASTVEEIDRLFRRGDHAAALQRADAAIAANPRNAQLRFTKGMMLMRLQRADEALVVFERLTQEYPELPEPHNNLAVLYGAKGQWLKARESLEAALRADPAYTTAQENLGDVYLQLALQSFQQANAERKLTLVQQLLSTVR